MRIVIAGGTGNLGRALTRALVADGHDIVVLTRDTHESAPPDRRVRFLAWNPDGSVGPWAEACEEADALVNLAGASIGDGRWTPARKTLLRESRLAATRSLTQFVCHASAPPRVFVSSSATGFYGNRGDTWLDETAAAGSGFLADLAAAWEHESAPAAPFTRLVLLRTGIVLDPTSGALAKMIAPFKLGLGGPFGSGGQYMSWIHRGDWVSLARWLLTEAGVQGPVNAVAPEPVTNGTFARTLGRVMGRPAIAVVPGFVLRLALGEMAGPLLLDGQRVAPAAATRAGFTFAHPQLEGALEDLLSRG